VLRGQAERVHWYSLFDLPGAWEATTRHKQREGSSYFRHFHMGLIREDGTPKPALDAFAEHAAELGICQWFHYEDHRLDDAVRWLRRLGVRRVRTGLSWSDHARDGCERWFDRQMRALEEFEVTVTFCFTPGPLRRGPPLHQPPPGGGAVRRLLRRGRAEVRGMRPEAPAERGRTGSQRWGYHPGNGTGAPASCTPIPPNASPGTS
jgi:hypothetical protein